MKNFTGIFLLTAFFFASSPAAKSQQPVKNYEQQWKNAEAFIKKNLPKSALEEVKKIYALAKKDAADAQLIKSLVYITGLQQEIREDNEVVSIKEIETEIAGSKEPASAILNSIAAEMYWNYFQQNRWRLYNRSATVSFKKDDIATWSADDFHKKISQLYLASVSHEKLLQQTRLESYDAIIIKGNVRHLRPTLYDLLAHRALQYFENNERDISKPAYAFEINQAAAFDPAADFIKTHFTTSDTLSLQHKALLIYQKLIAFHLNDAKPDALIDADLQRMEFVKNNSTHPGKDQLYFNAINHIAQQYQNLPAASQAWYLMANYYEEKAREYKPYGDSTHRLDRIKAKEICEKVLLQKDSSEGKINCYNLLVQLNKPSLQFRVEKVNIPEQPFRAMINYRNVSQLYLRIIKPDEKLKLQLENQYDEKYWPALLAAKPFREWQQALPAANDMQDHATEIKVDALPVGEYILISSSDKNFSSKKTSVAAGFFYVSNISFVNNGNDFFVLSRDNGQPLVNASVVVWVNRYDYSKSKYVKEKTGTYITDANGFFRMVRSADENNRYGFSYQLDITHHGDRLFMNDMINDYYYRSDNSHAFKTDTSVFLFTDRSIYRPGQTAFFKGIVLSKNRLEKKAKVLDGYETILYLRDANYQNIDSVKLKTNEYGSFSGKFQLPVNGLNGYFSLYLKDDKGAASFRVEEYKRPKFYVEYEPLKGTYQVNDTITVTGMAKAYAGNNIDGALVKYRVVRHPRFIYPWLISRWWQPPYEEMEITHGEIKTDQDGKFMVKFAAIPDLRIEKKFEPVFDYTVYADVTDINGETRSGNRSVSVSYKALLLQTDIPEKLPADSLKDLSIRTQNMNGEYEPAVVTVTITKLKEEKRLIRQRFWERPDQFTMSKEQYISLFPYDEYDNESDHTSWEKGAIVFSKTDSVLESGKWKVGNGKWEPGLYVVEMVTKDKNGEEVKDLKYIELYDEKSNRLSSPQYLWAEESDAIEPGETATAKLGTTAHNLFVIQTLDKSLASRLPSPVYSYFKLSDEKKTLSFPVTEADRGGYGLNWMFVKHNRFYQHNDIIKVPWSNKELAIEYATYRDKTLPGSEEKWKLKISGYKKEKVAAEMLAGMYDASLDQFYLHKWQEPGIWSYYFNANNWNGNHSFSNVVSFVETKYPEYLFFNKAYDGLLTNTYQLSEVVKVGYGRAERKEEEDSKLFLALPAKISTIRVAAMGNAGLSDESAQAMKFTTTISTSDKLNYTKQEQTPETHIRKNFNETAFFFPDLRTDSSGAIEFSFTMPEALTKWKFQALAHTKDLAFGYSSKEIITQKQLMVQPNPPRFLREGDKMELIAKVVNLTEKELTGQAMLQLMDAATNEPVDGILKNIIPRQYFTVAAGQSEAIRFPIEVPFQFTKALTWRIVAQADAFSDGEENVLPVLSNRMLVTETLPLNIKGSGTKQFTFDKLLNAGTSGTLQHHALTVEYTSNPAWYAVQALPYLMEYPYECAEQTWNRYYANALASMIANSSPRIKQIVEQWKTTDTPALLSSLQKNEELKSVLLEETPWVLQAKSESEQKKNMALLFDMVRMSNERSRSLEKLKQMQSSNGGFVWFKGGPDDRYITQYIITGIGHLKKLGVETQELQSILKTAIPYLDKKIKEDYDNLKKSKTDLNKYTPGYTQIQYLYMRSFFPDHKIAASQTAYDYFKQRSRLTWAKQNKYMQGMIALALSRTGEKTIPAAILKSLKETAVTNEELGMYWKDAAHSWWWYEAPLERQALLIEAFSEIGQDTATVDALKTWLLKNKQTNNWSTTKATAEACYALLLQGTNWLSTESSVTVSLGNTVINSINEKQEAGTGYFKKTIEGNRVNPRMGNITITREASQNGSWGAVYWQYFENLDKITTASTPLQLNKKLFVEKNTDRGPVLSPVNEGEILKVGDKIKVRIELRADRDMEYVHMKDMRASALEPVNVLSSYKWQDGLGYYESTKDAGTHFFFNYLRKGTYVFEYPLFVTQAGDFSNGVTTIQCMYAPEFSSHSEGIRITVE